MKLRLFQKALFFFIFTVLIASIQQDYIKITNTIDPQAKCLDGSPATLYVHEGSDKNNFLIFFQGGGYCGDTTLAKTTQSCYQRSKTLLGSSKQWPKTIQGQGYLSTDPSKSKFANWTKFIFIYCDGSIHQGNTQAPLKYKDATLYFRGARIVRSHFKWIQQNYHMSGADNLVLTGCSAGAVASLFWTNYVLKMLKNPSALSTIADSAIFLDVKTQGGAAKIQSSTINIYKLANIDQKSPLQICNSFYHNSEWKCLFAIYGFPSVQGRILLIQSQYDSFAIESFLQINCLQNGKSGLTMSNCSNPQMKTIQKYRDQFMDFATNYMQFQKNSLWTIACSNHCYASIDFYYDSNEQRIPSTIGDSVKDAVQNFVFQKKRIADIDAQKWPGNHPCAY